MNPYPGEIWLADLGFAAKRRPVLVISYYDLDSETETYEEELDPVLVVSRYDPDPPRALVTHIPLTTEYRQSRYEVPLPKSKLKFLDQDSYANVQGLTSTPKVRLKRKLGKAPNDVMIEIKNALVFALDLEIDSPKIT